jgi:hypothetical protein
MSCMHSLWMILVEKLIHPAPVKSTFVMIVSLASDGKGNVTKYTTTVSAERAPSEPHQNPFQTGSHRYAFRFHQQESKKQSQGIDKCCQDNKCCMLRIFGWNDIRTFAHLLQTFHGVVVWKLLKCRGRHVWVGVL